MTSEATVRLPTFRGGTRLRMADDQEWSFADPPPPGVDAEYDALYQALREAEDRAEVLRIELAISILLLARNYALSPADYRQILSFDDDSARLKEFQLAVAEIIRAQGDRPVVAAAPQSGALPAESRAPGRLRGLFSSWAVLLNIVLGS